MPRSRGGLSVTENCVPACLACNGHKSDTDAFDWYRRQRFYDPRRAMAIRAWVDGDLRLAVRLLQWANPESAPGTAPNAAPSSAPSSAPVEGRSPAAAQQRKHGPRQEPAQRSTQPHGGRSKDAWETPWGWQAA